MIHESEIITLLLVVGVLIFIIGNRFQLRRMPAPKILLTAFSFFFISFSATVFEGFFWKGLFNSIEHICYAVSSVLVAIWCFRVFVNKSENP